MDSLSPEPKRPEADHSRHIPSTVARGGVEPPTSCFGRIVRASRTHWQALSCDRRANRESVSGARHQRGHGYATSRWTSGRSDAALAPGLSMGDLLEAETTPRCTCSPSTPTFGTHLQLGDHHGEQLLTHLLVASSTPRGLSCDCPSPSVGAQGGGGGRSCSRAICVRHRSANQGDALGLGRPEPDGARWRIRIRRLRVARGGVEPPTFRQPMLANLPPRLWSIPLDPGAGPATSRPSSEAAGVRRESALSAPRR